MKKVIAILLAVLSVFSCFAISASAAEGEEPELTPSQYYIGQILYPGDTITSAFDTCESLVFTYTVDAEEAENVTSAQQGKFAGEEFKALTSFRDNLASFTSGKLEGVYTVLGAGDVVGEMEVGYGKFLSGAEILGQMSSEEAEKYKGEITLSIDFDYNRTTYYQYTNIVAWEIVSIVDNANALNIKVKAVFETSEPTGWQNFVEGVYVRWTAMLDKLGDMLLKVVPALLAFWAKILGKGWAK